MKTQTLSVNDRQKRFALFFPLLTVPFITLMFWTMKANSDASDREQNNQPALNMEIPDANFEKKHASDKMSFYTQAQLDSAKRKELSENDPYIIQQQGLPTTAFGSPSLTPGLPSYNPNVFSDPNEAKIYGKLGELNHILNQPAPAVSPTYGSIENRPIGQTNMDLDRLQGMMTMMQQGQKEADPEMQQINGLLEKILDIQHPERAEEKLKSSKEKRAGEVYAVTSNVEETPITVIKNSKSKPSKALNGFFGLNDLRELPEFNSISVVVHDNQTILSGSIVKLRLTTDIMIMGQLIPKDNFLFGEATISGERLKIEINTILYNNSIYPVKLSVYDLDGMAGIHIPGAISRDVAKESGTDLMQGLGINSFDPSLATQAASAGIELSKNLIKRKVKLVKVTLKSGYKLLLKDEKQQNFN